ncbi:uncharacterized protein LOC17900325 isoform X2 [Capsella rubella]|uniref:uncharacterized protein LOC17900325 isoform X2 n=1 Tax=Capsella rubella TaxID=81985 RepID=UPI000CD5C08F|nr:uncharacterized protein LOC17900325 isoform X2 [Capsella rubella]
MGRSPGFGGWINQNTQQPSKDECKRSENVKSKSRPEINTQEERDEMKEQLKLWRHAEKKEQWEDFPPKENVSRKVVSDDGSRKTVEAEKAVAWKFRSWSGTIPITLDFVENRKNLSAVYVKNKMMFMKTFEGSWKVEPIYVVSERLCKNVKPRSREEYKKCSGGQGKIASKVTMNQTFQPSSLLNLPPLSWYIRKITVKITKTLVEDLQDMGAKIRGV